MTGLIGWLTVALSEGDNPNLSAGIGLIGAGALFRHVIAPLDLVSGTKYNQSNIEKNRNQKLYFEAQYEKLRMNEWEPELGRINRTISKKNAEIRERNKKKKAVEISYE